MITCRFKIVKKKRLSLRARKMLKSNKGLYTSWSNWSKCTPKCQTQRRRKCKYETLCGTKQIKLEAYCYTEGSKCERKFKKGEFKHLYEANPESNDIVKDSDRGWSTAKVRKLSSKKNQCGKGSFSKAAMALRIIGKLSVISNVTSQLGQFICQSQYQQVN